MIVETFNMKTEVTCKELHVSIKLLLLFENEHEVVTKAALHHNPINGARKIDISCQKYNVFPLEGRYRLFRILQKKNYIKIWQ